MSWASDLAERTNHSLIDVSVRQHSVKRRSDNPHTAEAIRLQLLAGNRAVTSLLLGPRGSVYGKPISPARGEARVQRAVTQSEIRQVDDALEQPGFLKEQVARFGKNFASRINVLDNDEYQKKHVEYLIEEKKLDPKTGERYTLGEAKRKAEKARGFTWYATNMAYLNAGTATLGSAVHESMHMLSSRQAREYGTNVNEGLTEYFTRRAINEYKIPFLAHRTEYQVEWECVDALANNLGPKPVEALFFEDFPIQWPHFKDWVQATEQKNATYAKYLAVLGKGAHKNEAPPESASGKSRAVAPPPSPSAQIPSSNIDRLSVRVGTTLRVMRDFNSPVDIYRLTEENELDAEDDVQMKLKDEMLEIVKDFGDGVYLAKLIDGPYFRGNIQFNPRPGMKLTVAHLGHCELKSS